MKRLPATANWLMPPPMANSRPEDITVGGLRCWPYTPCSPARAIHSAPLQHCSEKPTIEGTLMAVTFSTARLTPFAIFAVAGATALSISACGASNNTKPTTSASPTSSSPTSSSSPSASAKGKDWIHGQIASVSDNAIQVTQQNGTATVDFTPSTKVTEITPAQLTDVTAGSCVRVRPTSESTPAASGAVTAESVNVSSAVDGKCPQPKAPAGGSTTTAPAAPPSDAPAAKRSVRGTVESVTGNTIKVTATDPNGSPSETDVTVTDTTKYTKKASADAQALAEGKCIAARGTKDGGGALQATAIIVRPAENGSCIKPGKQQPR
jgi:hypothetical protein